MKSGRPGVSSRLTTTSPSANDVTAARMLMPRRRSMSSESVRVVPASTLPGASRAPASNSRRSVRLVLPASTWATMPRLRVDGGEVTRQLHGWTEVGPGRGSCSHVCSWVVAARPGRGHDDRTTTRCRAPAFRRSATSCDVGSVRPYRRTDRTADISALLGVSDAPVRALGPFGGVRRRRSALNSAGSPAPGEGRSSTVE